MGIKTTTAILVFQLSVFLAAAQKTDNALETLLKNHPVEKLYIHYDKDYYVPGETVWFKAYLLSDGKPSGISNHFYLQLTDASGKVIINQHYPVMGAVVKGSIPLPDTLTQGNYYVRALTPYMLNYDESFIYTKNIVVGRPSPPSTMPAPALSSLQFFPEGGQLIDGILVVTAFKATDQYGRPAEADGIIRTDDGSTIASFHAYHDGIGKVQFKPQAGKKYFAEVETAAGKRSFPLPAVQASGVSIRIQNEKGGKKFLISRSANEKDKFGQLQIVVQQNHHIVFESDIDFETYLSLEGHLGTDSLPSGILQFTLFNKDGLPLAERLCFHDQGEYRGAAMLNSPVVSTDKRGLNEIEVSFPESIQRSCSMSVIDLRSSGNDAGDNIFSRFLLTSDLKGYINNPAWYFAADNDSTRTGLDNLMLTHGWSRFVWTRVLNNEFPQMKYSDKPLLSLSGLVVDPATKKPIGNGKLSFLAEGEDSTSQSFEVNVDGSGRFQLDSVAFFGTTRLYYGFTDKSKKAQPASVTLDEDSVARAVQLVPADIVLRAGRTIISGMSKDEWSQRLQQARAGRDPVKTLENVNVNASSGGKPVDAVNEKYTTGTFRGQAKETLDNINEPVKDRSLSAIDYIKNRVQQVEYQGNRFVSRKNFSLMSGQKWPVAVFLNEQLADAFQLVSIRATDLALVKYFEAGFVGVGSTFPGGAIAVYTKEKLPEEKKADKIEYVTSNGYTITREFYNPDYSQPGAGASTDQRTTLYWNPNLVTDTETKTLKIKFYNSDVTKAFKLVMEGFDANGKLLHEEKIIRGN